MSQKGVKMKAEEKLPYIYNHISDLEENLKTIKEYVKYVDSDIKIIKKFSKTENFLPK